MPARHFRHSARVGSARRRTTWARSVGVITNAAAANFATVDLLAEFKAAGGNTQGVTVGRCHLRWSNTTLVAPSDEIAIGVLKGQDSDVGASVVGAPEPLAKPYADWLYWSVFYGCDQPGAGTTFYEGGSNNWSADIRAKRKLADLNETLNLVVRNAQSGTFPATTLYSASTLLILP